MNLQCTHAHTGLRPSDAFQAVNFDLKYTHIPIPSGRLWGRYEGCGGRGGADCRHWDCRLEPKAPNAISLIQLQALCRCVCVWERDSKTVSIYSVCVILTVKESREIIRYRNQNLSVLPKHWEKPRRAEGEKRSSRQTDRQRAELASRNFLWFVLGLSLELINWVKWEAEENTTACRGTWESARWNVGESGGLRVQNPHRVVTRRKVLTQRSWTPA